MNEKTSRRRKKIKNIFKKVLILSDALQHKQTLKKRYKVFKKTKKTNFFFKIGFFLLKKLIICDKEDKLIKNYKKIDDKINAFLNGLEDGFKLNLRPECMENALSFDPLINNYPLNN